MTQTTFDFQDGNGPVPAHQHTNGGGWIADTAHVDPTARVFGNARVFRNAWVFGDAQVFGDARVSGAARVSGDARVSGGAWVFGDAWVSGNAWVFEGVHTGVAPKPEEPQTTPACDHAGWLPPEAVQEAVDAALLSAYHVHLSKTEKERIDEAVREERERIRAALAWTLGDLGWNDSYVVYRRAMGCIDGGAA